MHIKLVSPKVSSRPMDSAFKRHMAPPLALLALGALTPPEHTVEVADENVEKVSLADSPDLVGITVKADTAKRSFEMARIYRERGIPVILGGIHPTSCPEECGKFVDSVVVGEAEEIWQEILRDAEAGRLKPIYRKEGTTDISKSPIPRWELIKGKNYLYTDTLCIGRGCPWRCGFCYNSSPNIRAGYRMKPIANIISEIKSLKTAQVMFIDDNFIGSPVLTKKLIRELMPLGITWHTAVSADIGKHDDILDMMRDSGCKSLFIGFETLNGNNLEDSGKKQNKIDEYSSVIRKIHDRGMMVNASIVFGFDNDTPDVFESTLEWLVSQKVETMTGHILTPYPGTALHAQLEKENRIIDRNLDRYNTSHVVFKPARMSPEELKNGYLWVYKEFYSWRRIMQRIPDSAEQIAPYLMFNIMYRKYGKLFSLLGKAGMMPAISGLARKFVHRKQKSKSPARLFNFETRNCHESSEVHMQRF